jgi:ribosomal protein L40E
LSLGVVVEIPYRSIRMTVCPWCKAKNPPGAQACLRCGKRPGDHPSVTGRVVGDEFGEADEASDGPALDLDLATTRAQTGTTEGPLGREVGDGFGDDDDEQAQQGGALDLDLASPNDDYVPQEQPAPSVSEKAKPREQIAKPGAATAAAAQIEIDPYEIKALADYGPDPKGIVQAVPYSLRVLRRQRELKRALENVRKQLKDAEVRRDERLIELGTLLKPIILGNPDYASIAGSLGSAEKLVAEREAALLQTNAQFREKAAAVDAEIAGVEPALNAAREKVNAATKAFEDADRLRQKHEARRKRVEIDVRAAQAKVAALDTSPNDRSAAQTLIATANQERETRAAEERLATQAAKAAEDALSAARAQLQQVEGQQELLRKKRRALEQEFSRQGAVRTEGVDAASKDVRNVLLDVGRKTWQAGPDVEGAAMRRKGVTDAEAQVKRLQLDMEKHVRALGAADRNAVRNGLIVLGAAVVVILGLFIVWRATRTNPYLDQQPKSAMVTSQPYA